MTSYIKRQEKRKFTIGAVLAASLPIMIGLILLIIPIIAEQEIACRRYGSTNVSMSCEFYRYIGAEFYWFIMLPIILSFIFVAPYVAAKSASQLKENTSLEWRNIFATSISNSTKANFWVAIAYNIILLLIFIVTAIGMSGASEILNIIVTTFFFVTFIQFGLWLCITLPLALICATIFGLTVQPKKNS